MKSDFDGLTPEFFLPEVERALGANLTGLASALSSYINRVYEIESASGEHLIVKFYRPGRWSEEAVLEEHDFLWDCDEAEIPAVAPYELENGSTLGHAGKWIFAVFPKKHGRNADLESEENLIRAGCLLGRIHNTGEQAEAPERMVLTPETFAEKAMHRIFDSGVVTGREEPDLMNVCEEILDIAEPLFEDTDRMIRIHGDFHRGNLLERPGEGLMAIDFDDMLTGPPVQDIWLLLPGPVTESEAELEAILKGYTMFRPFRRKDLRLIEPLRAMRMMHFLSWCAVQSGDRRFRDLYPDWGTEGFWQEEIRSFRDQLEQMKAAIERYS